jgi:hypothetical protein
MRDYTIALLPREEIFRHWPAVETVLGPAVAHSRGQFTLLDIKRFIAQGKMGCVTVMNDEGRIIAALTAVFLDYPQHRAMQVQFLGGTEGLFWGRHMLAMVEQLARNAGCTRIEFQGRKEWGSVLRPDGYEAVSTLYEKVLPPCDTSSGDRSTETAPLP